MGTADSPAVALRALDTLWIQVAGTLCNLRCTHCFISCSPTNHAHAMMSLAEILPFLDEAAASGTREYYLTGGEPFLNPEILPIVEATIARGPVSILTNGVLLKPDIARRLREIADGSPYSLDLRISIDGWDAASNDEVRGRGTFERILAGLRNLAEAGLSPVLTVTEACTGAASAAGRARFLELLREVGLARPRLKVMPLLRIGAETSRTRGYGASETLRGTVLDAAAQDALQCGSCRMVTSRGVYVCPILIDEPGARMGRTLAEARRPFTLAYDACWTCHAEGLSCRT
jgi:MoaA/NifB/PqqE/SkfB family radical SAM enzyme